MTTLPKDALLYIFNADIDSVVLILESILDAQKSVILDEEIIHHSLKDKANTVRKIKEAIAINGLDSAIAIKKTNQEILHILLRRKTEHRGNTSDIVIKEVTTVETVEAALMEGIDEGTVRLNYDNTIDQYLTDMERQAFLSIIDKSIDTSIIDDLPDKTKRYYIRMAAGKLKIVNHL